MSNTVPTPESIEELLEYIESVLKQSQWTMEDYEKQTEEERSDSYSRAADAMWQIPLAAFNFAASKMGASGFQAGYAALKFLGEANNLRGPYAYIDGENMLYPQYDILGKVAGYLEEWRPWAKEEAQKKLKELEADPDRPISPRVVAHWKRLAE